MKTLFLKRMLGLLLVLVFMIGLFLPEAAFLATPKKALDLTSTAFKNGGAIPVKHSYLNDTDFPESKNISIPLKWKLRKNLEKRVKSFALVMVDLHPEAGKFIHWMVLNIPKDTRELAEGSQSLPEGSVVIKNSYSLESYGGPNPPPDDPAHVYEIALYALNVKRLNVSSTKAISLNAFKKLIKRKVVAQAKLKGKFKVPEEVKVPPEEESQEVQGPVTLEIMSVGFRPLPLTVKKGTTVKFINVDSEPHWPASAAHPNHTLYPEGGGCINSAFDACKALKKDEVFSFIFNHVGTWTYHDHLNPEMQGTVIVTE